MRTIQILDQTTIDKIAAGEVVERPASVVKELVENAIDALASSITVEIKDGGKSLIRITDNGGGIPMDQVPTAFMRHATSKLTKIEDLEQIASLGFRGEALSSIGAVSQMEVITKTPSAMAGIRYVFEGGKEISLEEIGAPDGTTFLVRNLFYNTPARSKFLKTSMTEAGYITSIMEQIALSHPEISFKYMVNGQVKLHTSGNSSTKDVIYHLYGRDIAKALLEVHFENEYLTIDGYIGKPEISRGNRNFENYYINGRYVKNRILTKAIEDAYKGFMMQHKFPFTALHFHMTGNDLDVNVHPTKMEVRFSKAQEIYNLLYRTLYDALHAKEMIPEVTFDRKREIDVPKETVKRAEVPEPFEKSRAERTHFEKVQNRQLSDTDKHETKHQEIPKTPAPCEKVEESKGKYESEKAPLQERNSNHEQMELFDDHLLSKKARERHVLIGQIFDTYWLVQYGDKFYIIDQHAAHEKVLYERIMKEFEQKTVTSQFLSPPIIISLSLQEQQLLEMHMNIFQDFGFEIEGFGGREYSIRAVPDNLYGVAEEELFRELLDHLEQEGKKTELLTDRLATAACKAAVKGNHSMSAQEANVLIDELLSLDNPYHCPHGRPTIISMTKTELEKKFKRIV